MLKVGGTLEAATRYLNGIVRRPMGREYVTVILPPSPNGDEIVGEGWATGQGTTLSPLTSTRVHNYSEELIGAHLRYAPYRSEIRNRDEYWLVDAVTNWYAWKAAAIAGLVGERELEREFSCNYVATLSSSDVERNLERIYSADRDAKLSRRILAPLALIQLDREIGRASSGRQGLDAILSGMFRGSEARSLWQSLPRSSDARWALFRDRYVRGTKVASVNDVLTVTPTMPQPSPERGAAADSITFAFTGQTHGYLENCGCKVNQSGGIARRATVLKRIRAGDSRTVLFDAGSAFAGAEGRSAPDFLARQEESFYLEAMGNMKYDAMAVGTTELAGGMEHFREVTQQNSLPYVASNLDAGNALKSIVIRRGGLRIGVLGVFEPPAGPRAGSREASAISSIPVGDPVEAIRREVPALRKDVDLIVVLGSLSPVTIRSVVEACPTVDVIISADYELPSIEFGGAHAKLLQDDNPGFLGRTLVLYTNLENYGLQLAHLKLDSDRRIASATFEDCWLRENIRDDPGVRESLNRFYDRVGRLAQSQASVDPLFETDQRRMTGHYVGAKQCAACHAVEYDQWRTTKHASAYKTLLDVHRHYQPRCIVCHVVGYGTQYGYRLGDREEPLGNVQCEICHGPGRDHVAAPSFANISRAVPAAVCGQCHNSDHSDNFVFSQKIQKVIHLQRSGGAAG